ncbi:MAG: biotin--[acetyl-CoA-carboxylase] ligase [Methanocorpusculum sp.]|nr:biotin--[acetyl-CoA-carboxylase] ligase [Methanocorpusculum sp.]
MKSSDLVLKYLEESRGFFVSGEDLALKIGISRTAVWKAVKNLESRGYKIEAVTNKGYSLSPNSDVLSPEIIKNLSGSPNVILKKSTESTNTDAKLLAVSGAEHGTAVIANEQIKGKGRLGRSFYSSEGGIYLSIVLRLKTDFSSAVLVTTASAVAVCKAVEKFSDLTPQIKWVNDIFVGGKKVCGISCEAVSDFESGVVDFVIVGIGVNFKTKSFPPELEEIAGSLFFENEAVTRNELAGEIIKNVLEITESLGDKKFIDEYRRRSFLIGEDIIFRENNVWSDALCLGIDDDGGLIVSVNGVKRTLVSGEVSVRRK